MSAYSTQNTHAGIHTLDRPAKVDKRFSSQRYHHKTTVPAEHVLEMRRLHEVDRKTYVEVGKLFPQYPKTYIRAVLQYMVRANLQLPTK